jgi:hypothetical protein
MSYLGDVVPSRPYPPEYLRHVSEMEDARDIDRTEPAVYMEPWIRAVFLDEASLLYNPDHAHLQEATIGVLWTAAPNSRGGVGIVGNAEMPQPKGNRWQIARQKQQILDWFGIIPDFLMTLSAPYCAQASDATFCALVDHELTHMAQRQKDGEPWFSKETGKPLWMIREHDVSQFTSIVRRYGQDAAGVRHMVEAAKQHQLERVFPDEAISFACGTCTVKR